MSRIGKNQIEYLIMLGSPTMMAVSTNRPMAALVKRGLLKQRDGGKAVCITSAGLRALADEMDAGRVDDALSAMRKAAKDRVARNAAARSLSTTDGGAK